MTNTDEPNNRTRLLERCEALKLYGLIEHAEELDAAWLEHVTQLLDWEEQARRQRGLERRLGSAHLGAFKPLADFDWSWPRKCDRGTISDLMTLGFMDTATNVILVGPNGVGKSTIAQNLVHRAVIAGSTARFVTAAKMLGDLAAQDGASALERRLRTFARPELLVIDELGYLSYGNRHADLLFEVVNRRYEKKSTVITTNRAFAEWGEVFPNAPCVVSIVDRLTHHSEILQIDGESYRLHEANQRAAAKKKSGITRGKNKPDANDGELAS
jgi:DNA replication protein DnaC